MALFWPEQGIALEVIDDPASTPFVGDEDVEVIRVLSEDLEDREGLDALAHRLAEALDEEIPDEFENEEEMGRWLRAMTRQAVIS